MRAAVSPNHSSQGSLPAHLDGQGESLETWGKRLGCCAQHVASVQGPGEQHGEHVGCAAGTLLPPFPCVPLLSWLPQGLPTGSG